MKSYFMLHDEDDIILIAKYLLSSKRALENKVKGKVLVDSQQHALKRLTIITNDFTKKAALLKGTKNRTCLKGNTRSLAR